MKFSSKEKKDFKEARILLNNCEYEKSLKIFCELLKKNYHPFSVLCNLSIIYEKINKLDSLLKGAVHYLNLTLILGLFKYDF